MSRATIIREALSAPELVELRQRNEARALAMRQQMGAKHILHPMNQIGRKTPSKVQFCMHPCPRDAEWMPEEHQRADLRFIQVVTK